MVMSSKVIKVVLMTPFPRVTMLSTNENAPNVTTLIPSSTSTLRRFEPKKGSEVPTLMVSVSERKP